MLLLFFSLHISLNFSLWIELVFDSIELFYSSVSLFLVHSFLCRPINFYSFKCWFFSSYCVSKSLFIQKKYIFFFVALFISSFTLQYDWAGCLNNELTTKTKGDNLFGNFSLKVFIHSMDFQLLFSQFDIKCIASHSLVQCVWSNPLTWFGKVSFGRQNDYIITGCAFCVCGNLGVGLSNATSSSFQFSFFISNG